MSDGVLVRRRRYPGTQAFTIWSLVADPSRLPEWAPVAAVDHMGTAAPAPGQLLFVTTRWRRRRRLRIDEWEAGHRVRVVVDRRDGPAVLDVTVTDEIDGATVELRFTGEDEPVRGIGRFGWDRALGRCLAGIARSAG